MKIIEQTEHVLTFQNSSSRDFWCETIFIILCCPITIALLLALPDSSIGWLRVLFLFILLLTFFLSLQRAWSSNVVRLCSFSKVLNRVTINFYGIEPITTNFLIGEIRGLEVRKIIQCVYGSVHESYQLWLVTRSENIFLSDTHGKTASEKLADRVREFLLPIERSI
jgi:hypothetical protein